MKGALAVFIAFLAFGFALPFLTEGEQGNQYGTLFITLLCTVVFGFFSILTWQSLRRLPFADVAADDDGIWYIHIGKDKGLTSWEKIQKVKERAYMQRLDLLDYNSQELLRIEYQLLGFEVLRDLLNEKTSILNPEFNKTAFSKNPLYHLFYLVGVVGFSALGYYVGKGGNPLLGYGAMSVLVAFIIYEYLVTTTGIKIISNGVVVTYPFIKRNVPFSDIEDIFVVDEFHSGSRIPEVWIISKNAKKPFKLKNIGADSNVIYKVLLKTVTNGVRLD